MEEFSWGSLVSNLIPAILAGVIGAVGAYSAVKVDTAVLLSNQTALIAQGKDISESVIRHESEINLLRYKVEVLQEEIVNLKGE